MSTTCGEIWEDIDYDREAIAITKTSYNAISLNNLLYEVIDDNRRLREAIKTGEMEDLTKQLEAIREHRNKIATDEVVNAKIADLFIHDTIKDITPLDRLYINMYYRRILRAKMELDFIGKDISENLLVIPVDHSSKEDLMRNKCIIATLRLLRLTCAFLGIPSTTHSASFPLSKLYMPLFWNKISEKFLPIF
jgi:hypothetical protein